MQGVSWCTEGVGVVLVCVLLGTNSPTRGGSEDEATPRSHVTKSLVVALPLTLPTFRRELPSGPRWYRDGHLSSGPGPLGLGHPVAPGEHGRPGREWTTVEASTTSSGLSPAETKVCVSGLCATWTTHESSLRRRGGIVGLFTLRLMRDRNLSFP